MKTKPAGEAPVHEFRSGVLDSLYEALQDAGGAVEAVPPEAMLAVISKWESIRGSDGAEGFGSGPNAHEDLNIAELIDSLRVTDEHVPGKLAFRGPSGCVRWLAADAVAAFREQYGHEHPSNYADKHGARWEEDFFALD